MNIETKRAIFKIRIKMFNNWYDCGELSLYNWIYLILETCLGLIRIKIYRFGEMK